MIVDARIKHSHFAVIGGKEFGGFVQRKTPHVLEVIFIHNLEREKNDAAK